MNRHNQAWRENKHCQEFEALRAELDKTWFERPRPASQAERDQIDAKLRAEHDVRLIEGKRWLKLQLEVEDLMIDEGFDDFGHWYENVDPIPFGSKSPLGQRSGE